MSCHKMMPIARVSLLAAFFQKLIPIEVFNLLIISLNWKQDCLQYMYSSVHEYQNG